MNSRDRAERPFFKPNRRPRRTIGLTPLIDVVFILLLFFMLASSFRDWRGIALPPPSSAAQGTTWNGALLVEIQKDGLRLSGQELSLYELTARLAAYLEKAPDRRVLVSPRDGVSLQETVTVLDRIGATGARSVSLAGGRNR